MGGGGGARLSDEGNGPHSPDSVHLWSPAPDLVVPQSTHCSVKTLGLSSQNVFSRSWSGSGLAKDHLAVETMEMEQTPSLCTPKKRGEIGIRRSTLDARLTVT